MTRLERAAGLRGIIYGTYRECMCGATEECESPRCIERTKRAKTLENSTRFKDAAKLVAGLCSNRETKLALVKRVHADNFESAIVRYMANEALPGYYAAILRSPNCIDRLVEGIFYKVCKIQPEQSLTEKISNLSNSLRSNIGRAIAYDRVATIQQFIHLTVDQYLGVGAAQSIPVASMRNALSAARLHLSIFDSIDRSPGYVSYIDGLSNLTLKLENDEPRPSTAPFGKRTWSKWRVRHLRPLSYYFPQGRRALLQGLNNLDEQLPSDRFVYEALSLYAAAL